MSDVREHLERLIFEVHGAEKGAALIEKLREQEDKYAESLKGLKKEARERSKAETKAAAEFEKSQKKRQEATKQTMKIAASGLAVLAAAAASASAQLEQAQGKIDRAFRKSGISIGDQAKAMDAADANARRLGLSLIETREHMARLLGATGDVAIATHDLALANDIAATGHMGAAQAVELLTKARKGELEELKQLEGLNKQSIEALGAISDQSERAAEAVKMLSQEYTGAADELKGTTDAMANLKEAGNDLLAALGDAGSGLISATAEWLGLVDEGEDGVGALAKKIREFSRDALEAATHVEAWKRWREQGGLTGDRDFFSFVSEIDTEKAIAAAEEGNQTPRTRENVGRGGRRGYGGGRGGHRDVPRDTAPPKTTGGRNATEQGPSGFEGDFGGDQQSLEEVAGAEAQALQEKEDRRRTFLNNIAQMELAHAEELKRIEQDQDDFSAKMEDNEKLAAKGRVDRAKERIKLEKEIAGAAVGAALDIASTITSVDETGKAALALQAGVAAAQAAMAWGLALMPGPPGGPAYVPGAIGLTVAAISAAAKAGSSIASPGKPQSKGGGKGARPQLSQDRERVNLSKEQDRSRETRASQTHVVNIYSTFGPSPQQSRELVDAVESEMRNRTGGR